MTTELEDEIKSLYAGTPDRFVEERDALASRLRTDGDAVGAKRVSGLKKPTVAAWAIDQLPSVDEATLSELVDAGRQLAAAQQGISTPGGADRLREISLNRRRLVDELVRTAARVLTEAGMPAADATLDKVTNTLMSIATDDAAEARVRAGILDKELAAPAGFGDDRLDATPLASVTELPSRSGGGPTEPTPEERRAAARLERLTAEAERLETSADELERDAASLRKTADAKEREAQVARRKADAARQRADDARDA